MGRVIRACLLALLGVLTVGLGAEFALAGGRNFVGYKVWSKADCKALVRWNDAYCDTADCKAVIRNNDAYCDSSDCKAIIRNNDAYCKSSSCKAIVRDNDAYCG